VNDLSIVVVALDPLVRAGLVSLLRGQGITIVAEVADLEQIHLYEPEANAVIWDSSDDTLDEITHLPILALVPEDIETNAFPNVQGMLYRSSSVERIVHALYALAQGLNVYEPAFVIRQPHSNDEAPTDLTVRELEVLQRLAEGLSNKAIAKALGISENTVKFHVNALLDKFGVGSRTEVVIKAIQNGLVTI
jgi:two-component system, NarL family, nitrate/nitrite response regulator NarL